MYMYTYVHVYTHIMHTHKYRALIFASSSGLRVQVQVVIAIKRTGDSQPGDAQTFGQHAQSCAIYSFPPAERSTSASQFRTAPAAPRPSPGRRGSPTASAGGWDGVFPNHIRIYIYIYISSIQKWLEMGHRYALSHFQPLL